MNKIIVIGHQHLLYRMMGISVIFGGVAILALACASPENSGPLTKSFGTSQREPTAVATPIPTRLPTNTSIPFLLPLAVPTIPPSSTPKRASFPTPVPEPAEVGRASAEILRTRAEEYTQAWNEQQWIRLHTMLVGDMLGFRERCAILEFTERMILAPESFEAERFAEGNQDIELRVTEVQVSGSSGVVKLEFFFDGLTMAEEMASRGWLDKAKEPYEQNWVFVFGRWSRAEYNY